MIRVLRDILCGSYDEGLQAAGEYDAVEYELVLIHTNDDGRGLISLVHRCAGPLGPGIWRNYGAEPLRKEIMPCTSCGREPSKESFQMAHAIERCGK